MENIDSEQIKGKGLYNPQLEELIDLALADGKITAKEKQVLFKKAQSLGVDLDEFEMVLEAKLVKLEQAKKGTFTNSSKLGNLKKCPRCGASIGSFTMKCPECGFEFSGIGPNEYVKTFSEEFQKVSKEKHSFKETYTGSWKNDFIKNYPLPLTKEDSFEMLNFILSKLEGGIVNSEEFSAWEGMYKAILSKMEEDRSSDSSIHLLVSRYRDKISKIKKKDSKKTIFFVLAWFGFMFLMSGVAIIGGCCEDDIRNKKNDKILELIKEGNLFDAKVEIKKGGDPLPLYEYYMENEMWDDAEEFIPELTEETYFDYCKKAVRTMVSKGKISEAKSFINRKIVFFEEFNDESKSGHEEWNTATVSKKLNKLINDSTNL